MRHGEPVYENIKAVARLEQEFLERRTFPERIADRIGAFAGSPWFVVLHVIWFTIWILMNLGVVPRLRPFDPFPFMLLSLAVSMEAVLLSTFVLMKQNRMSARADARAQLDLQINLLSERESTKNMQLLQRLCDHLGLQEVARDAEIEQLSRDTAVDALADELKKALPEH